MPEVLDLTALVALVADFAPPAPGGLDEDSLLSNEGKIAELGRHVSAMAALYAGEVAYRSRPELGYGGLAQRHGARTPEKLVQTITGGSLRDSGTLVRVGSLLTPARESGVSTPPWLVDVAAAVSAATLSVDAADAIRLGLGVPDPEGSADGVRADDLIGAAAQLLCEAPYLSLEQLAAAARNARAALAAELVLDHEQAMRDRRYLRFSRQDDGMTRVTGLLDPESAAIIRNASDAALSPRLGPRFVDPIAVARAERLVNDPRTNDQISVDTFVELTKIATAADDGTILGYRKPVVQLHVSERDLRERRGVGFFDGQLDAVSMETIERYICEAGVTPIAFDLDGQALDVGREQRTFTQRQRVALAARDGGCRFPGCDRPPSWAEAHHINPWSLGGKTDIADGILLCRHHHMLVHNNGWQFVREGAEYYVIPPAEQDPLRRRVLAPSKSRTRQRALIAS